MKITINKIIPFILTIAVILFCFSYIRTCNQNTNQSESISLLKNKAAADSIDAVNNLKEFTKEIVSIKSERDSVHQLKKSIEDSLDDANKIINKLLARYKPMKVDNDTGNTYVPNDFITDCSECFTELPHYQNLANKYRRQVHVEDSVHKKQDTIYEKRIAQLGKEKAAIAFNLNERLNTKSSRDTETKGILFGSISALSFNNLLPNGLGIGLIYQDNKQKQYGANIFNTTQGPIYMVNVSAPFIKFKRRK